MRKLTMTACAAGLAIALGTGTASAAQASSVIVVGPGQSIQAAINAARPGDTVFVRPGVYHQSVQIRTNGITLRGSGAFRGGTVLVPPKHFPKTRFVSSRTVFANDTAIGNDEAGFYVGDSPQADTVVRNDQAFGNQFGIFIRHARHVLVTGNVVSGNCQGILVLDDGQRGGAGNATIEFNRVFDNNKFCKKNEDTPVSTKGGGILLLGATHTLVTHNSVTGNAGKKSIRAASSC
jgi:nitrous oxidase accessory protein NosD